MPRSSLDREPSHEQRSRGRRRQLITPRELSGVSGESVPIPAPDRLVHLQFRRFAGCPICNVHLQSIVRRHDEIANAGVREVVVFHSTDQELRRYVGELPFAVILDPDKALYAEFVREVNTELPVWMPIEQIFVTVITAKARNHSNTPRWGSASWYDLWLSA